MTLVLEIAAVFLAALFLLRVVNLVVLMRWYRAPRPPGTTVDVDGRRVYYKLKGDARPVVVVEAALGAVSPEWWRIQDTLSLEARVLTYDRAGYGWSAPSDDPRLGNRVAAELKELLDTLEINEPVVLVGHSLGGLYVNHFARLYPSSVGGIVLIDPISPDNDRFRKELPPQVFRKSGVDETTTLKIMSMFNGFGLTRLLKKWAMRSYVTLLADPLPAETLSVLWKHMLLPHTPKTALGEYYMIQGGGAQIDLRSPEGFPAVPLCVITHSSEAQIGQIVRSGALSKEQGELVESIWQELIRAHMVLSPKSVLVVAERSSHSIHLDEPEILMKNILAIVDEIRRSHKTIT